MRKKSLIQASSTSSEPKKVYCVHISELMCIQSDISLLHYSAWSVLNKSALWTSIFSSGPRTSGEWVSRPVITADGHRLSSGPKWFWLHGTPSIMIFLQGLHKAVKQAVKWSQGSLLFFSFPQTQQTSVWRKCSKVSGFSSHGWGVTFKKSGAAFPLQFFAK